ncbi:peptidoglycan DD-metalloendopeptidase family protein [Streptacidiphilus sp. PB12-B1b]|uniref:peptidoglycan DD-metalloendopeptidase family protein n=1 Tax=Streptacidiphilus sp. PB12-B1b TaxID=2705012 RepID=UPI0015FA5AD3|nr:peptidoglycan DD-metalloendopeptidase family protein [Streptacidiphilus sp. PB12-B1b]QMU76166.1 peptidoglycan DD-metalloendopeptidase family protein [Streptacidiphilus sp. PB12-B1b]
MATNQGRHRRPAAPTGGVTLAKAAGVTAVGAALPVLTAGAGYAAAPGVWGKVAACESGGNWSADTGNGYFGGLQFSASTWSAYGGDAYAPTADRASEAEQIGIAQRVLREQGPGAWPVCSVRAGLTRTDGAGGAAPAPAETVKLDDSVKPAKPAPKPAKSAPKSAPESAKSAKPTATTAAKATATRHHTVRSGDTLSGIAQELGVPGGWQPLYAQNRAVVGGDPDLIHPGQHLSWSPAIGSSATAHTLAAVVKPPTGLPGFGRSIIHHHTAADSAYTAPISGHVEISEPYGVPGPWIAGHHTGVDLAVPVGTPVHAVAAGTVVFARWGGDYGNLVKIRHADGDYSLYAHLSVFDVRLGDTVAAGTTIGRSGATGNVTGPHLHFEIDTTDRYGSDVNPVGWLAEHGVTLD